MDGKIKYLYNRVNGEDKILAIFSIYIITQSFGINLNKYLSIINDCGSVHKTLM